MIDSKNQIIRSMKSYAVGGASEDACTETYIAADGKRKKRRKKGGCSKSFRSSSGSGGGGGGLLGGILGAGAAVAGGLGIKKMMDKQKNGGSVKKIK